MQNDIDAKHKRALQWFADHAGTVIAWPKPLDGGILLATKAKGIYKPRGCRYAQSVRQAIGAPYPDQDPSHDPAGRWEFRYFQEGHDPKDRDKYYTNLALLRCMEDKVPVGVIRQRTGKPDPTYEILGLGLVMSWEKGFFHIRSCAP